MARVYTNDLTIFVIYPLKFKYSNWGITYQNSEYKNGANIIKEGSVM